MTELTHEIHVEPEGSHDYAQPLTYAIFVLDSAAAPLAGATVHLELRGDGSFAATHLQQEAEKTSDLNGQVWVGWWEYPRLEPRRHLASTLIARCDAEGAVLRIGAAF